MHAGATAISAGGRHSMILGQNGSVWATGENEYGQLGDGTIVGKNSFVEVVRSGQLYTHTRPANFCTNTSKRRGHNHIVNLALIFACVCPRLFPFKLLPRPNTNPHLRAGSHFYTCEESSQNMLARTLTLDIRLHRHRLYVSTLQTLHSPFPFKYPVNFYTHNVCALSE